MYKKSAKLKIIRRNLEAGKRIAHALLDAGVRSYSTLKVWRRRPLIDRYILACLIKCDNKRINAVEDAHLKKMVEGKGSPVDYIFFLTNRRPDKWKHNTTLVNNTILNQNNNAVKKEVINVVEATEKLRDNISILKRNGINLD